MWWCSHFTGPNHPPWLSQGIIYPQFSPNFMLIFPPLLDFSLLYAPNNLIKLSCGIFHATSFWQQLTLLEVTWTTEAHHWIDVSIKTLAHTALPRGSRSWCILETLSNFSCARPRPPSSPLWDVMTFDTQLERASSVEDGRPCSWPTLASPSSLFLRTWDNISMGGNVAW